MNDLQNQTIPPIRPGDIISVYSAHESAWGKPAQTYCVRRVEPDGTPVSDMGHRHSLANVVSISRKESEDYVCLWKKENYEVAPWGYSQLQAMAEAWPEETKTAIADGFQECRKVLNNFCEENKEALATLLACALVCKVAKTVANIGKGESV